MYTGREDGFTLVELFISIMVSSIVIMAVYTLFNSQMQMKGTQDQNVEIQQNLRSAIYLLENDIRMAGYTGNSVNATPGFIAAGPTGLSLSFLAESDSVDNNGDGTVDEAGELSTVQYTLADANNDGDLDINRSVDGMDVPIAENIEAIEFYYTIIDNSGNRLQTDTPTDMTQIRAVEISILARSRNRSQKQIQGKVYQTASGAEWGTGGIYTDGFYRRFIRTNIACRNL